MAELDIISAEIFACKSDAPQIIWAKDMSPMFEANIIVKLKTESGIECVGGVLIPTEHHYDHSIVEACRNLFPEILGKNLEQRSQLTAFMLSRCVPLNPLAVSSIDIAMWDGYSKYIGKPLCDVLGRRRNSIDSYASTPLFHSIKDYVDFVKKLEAKNFRSVKFHTWCKIDFDLQMVSEVCPLFPNMKFMIDCEQRYNRQDALMLGNKLDELNFVWFEAPFDDFDWDSYQWLRNQIKTPVIGAGNSILDPHQIEQSLKLDIFHHARVDTTYVGGITQALKIMNIANKYKKNTELQSWSYPLGQAANLHIMLSHENCEYFEQVVPFEDHEHGAKTFIRTDQKGKVTANSNPGLGIEVDWEVINRDWYSYLKLDQNGLTSETRSI
jgi:L-alanine-DL-glutamate epimerase-like enolase superfamily enzyme